MGLRSYCSELFCEVLDAVIPNRTKRLIVISSLCPIVADAKELDDEYLALLNTQLSLCREEEALKLPLAMSKTIWNGLPNEIHPNEGNPNEVACCIMSKLPEWLRYDNDTVILGELHSLLRFNTVFHQAHTNAPCQQ